MSSMKLIRDADTLIGILERGDLKADFSAKICEAVALLHGLSEENPKKKYKAGVALKMKLSIENGVITIDNELSTTLPKKDRRSDIFFSTEEGALSTEHPSQHDMFGGPRVIEGERGIRQ